MSPSFFTMAIFKKSRWLGKVSRKKSCCSYGFCSHEGGEGPAQIFCHLFISAFLVNKSSLFPPYANNLNFKLFF